MKVSQKDAVFTVVMNYLDESGVQFEPFQEERLRLSKEQRSAVIGLMIEATIAGEVSVQGKTKTYDTTCDNPELRKYWNGTLTNWLNKDRRFNGNVKHEIKNPGSRAGQGDATLKNLKNLLTQIEAIGDEEQVAAVQAEIDKRTAELAAQKAKKVEIDPNHIPEELRHLIPA